MTNALVIIDYQNIHLTAHEKWAPRGTPKHNSLVHPLAFAASVLQKRQQILGTLSASGKPAAHPAAQLSAVWVYRGCPSNKNDPQAYRRSQAQRSEWTRDPRVQVTYRTLKYYRDAPPREKGVDVLVAINLVQAVSSGEFDVVILAAHDTDQEPALEAAVDLCVNTDRAVETAGWQGSKVLRPSGRQLWHTALDSSAFAWCLMSRCSRNGSRASGEFARETGQEALRRARVLSLAESMSWFWMWLMRRVSSAGFSSARTAVSTSACSSVRTPESRTRW